MQPFYGFSLGRPPPPDAEAHRAQHGLGGNFDLSVLPLHLVSRPFFVLVVAVSAGPLEPLGELATKAGAISKVCSAARSWSL